MARTTFDGPIRIRRGAAVTQATSRATGVTSGEARVTLVID